MILGVGTDLVNIQRIEDILNGPTADRFQEKYFHAKELETAHKFSTVKERASSLAKRYAAKEAFAKALGTGVREGVKMKDIYVLNDDLGCPYIKMTDTVQMLLKQKSQQSVKIDLSLSDDYPMAQAFVILSIQKEER